MRSRFNINGDLWYDVLDHVLLVSYDYSLRDKTWVALARSYKYDGQLPFTEYVMDAGCIFRSVHKAEGREALVLKQYKKKYGIKKERAHSIPKPPKIPDFIWRKGMRAAEFENLNGVEVVPGKITHRRVKDKEWGWLE